MGKREKEADSIELEQPEGVPKVGEISKEKLNENHEGLRPLPKAHKDRLNGSPKPPRVPKVPKAGGNTEGTFKKECPSFGADCKAGKYPESVLTENKDGIVFPQEEKQISEIDKKNGKNDEGWDFESPGNLVDKKTARWIEEQNEFLGKQEEKEFEEDRKEKDPPVFNPSGPIKVLQKQRANLRTGYEQTPQHVMGAQKGQALHPPLVVTNRRAVSWRGPGKRYPLKEKQRTQWGGYGKQYGRGGEEKVTRLIELIELKPRVIILLMSHKDKVVISQLKALGMDKVEMGEMKIEMIKRSIEILGLVLKMIVMKRVIQRILMN